MRKGAKDVHRVVAQITKGTPGTGLGRDNLATELGELVKIGRNACWVQCLDVDQVLGRLILFDGLILRT